MHQLRLQWSAHLPETGPILHQAAENRSLASRVLSHLNDRGMRLCVTGTVKPGPHAQLVAMAKRSKALEDRLRESEAREKRAREDAQVNGL